MVKVMREIGFEPTLHQSSKTLQSVMAAGVKLDVVVTVCGHAHDTCPAFPASHHTKVVHFGFDDPPELELNAKTEEEMLNHYRRVRDEIRDFVWALPKHLNL